MMMMMIIIIIIVRVTKSKYIPQKSNCGFVWLWDEVEKSHGLEI
jgi:hypothetical protein